MTETACVLLSNFIFPSDTSKETGLCCCCSAFIPMTETACVLLSNFIFPSDTLKETGLSVVVVLSSL